MVVLCSAVQLGLRKRYKVCINQNRDNGIDEEMVYNTIDINNHVLIGVNMVARWSKSEIQYLEKHGHSKSAKELSKYIKRGLEGIRHKKRKLDIVKNPTKIGDKLYKLTVLDIQLESYCLKNSNAKRSFAYCICECGKNKKVLLTNLRCGAVKSCGCLLHNKRDTNKNNEYYEIKCDNQPLHAEQFNILDIIKNFDIKFIKKIYFLNNWKKNNSSIMSDKIVYIIADYNTGELLKVGQSVNWKNRLGNYNNHSWWPNPLKAYLFETKTWDQQDKLETDIRKFLEKLGHKLPKDNTGMRLSRYYGR